MANTQQAYAVSSGVTYTGKILDANDVPVTASSVIFTVTIYDSSGKCWLYSEQRNLDLSQSAGTFAFEIGSDDATTLYGAAPSFNNSASGGPKNIADLFSNKKSFTGLGSANGCTGSYDPSASTDLNEGRLLSVFFKIGVSGTDEAIPPMRITPVPLAMQALAVNGYGTGELLRVDKSTVATAGINNNPLSLSQYTEFWSLVNKSSGSYLPVTGDVGIVGGNNKINNLLGQALPSGPATNGQVLVSNGTSWTLQPIGGASVASVSGTSPISVGGTATAPVISIPAASTSVNGYLTSADWNTFKSKQSSSLTSGNIFVGNASGVATGVSLSGDATINNSGLLTLKNTGTAGTYGSASLIPVITTDAQGRVTGITTSAPVDATKLPLAGGTMTGALNMGVQDIINVGNFSMAASKTLGLSSNATDPATPAAGQVWYNSTSNLIKYYDGSSVKSLGTSGGASQWTSANSDIYYNTGNVGIGTTSPAARLEISIPGGQNMITGYRAGVNYFSVTEWGDLSANGGTFGGGGAKRSGRLDVRDQGTSWNQLMAIIQDDQNTDGLSIMNETYTTSASAGLLLKQMDSGTARIKNAAAADPSGISITTSGNVGIGTAAPGSSLDVKGTLRLSGSTSGYVGFAPAAVAGSTTYTLPTTQGTAGQVLSTDGVAGNATLSWISPLTSTTGFLNGGNSFGGNSSIGNNDNYNLDFKTNNLSRMTIKSDGKIGIGTSAPADSISIYKGLTNVQTNINDHGIYFTRAWDGLTAGNIDLDYNNGILNITGASSVVTWANSRIAFAGWNDGGNVGKVVVNSGNVAAGMAHLAVAGSTAIGSTYYANVSPSTDGLIVEGNVGIGTTSPTYALDVNGTISGNNIYAQNGNMNVFGGVNHGIIFDDGGGDTDYWISRIDTDGDSGTDNDLFQIGKGTVIGTAPFLTVNNTGNVGIGTTNPLQKLHVTGEILANALVFDVAANTPGKIRGGTGFVALQTDGSDRLRIDYNSSTVFNSQAGSPLVTIYNSGELGVGTTTPGAKLDVAGHIANSGASASVGSCGTSPAITGNDTKGYVTIGSGLTQSCIITFNSAFSSAPVCTITWRGPASTIGIGVAATTTALTVNFSSDAQNLSFNYHCLQ
ncbi:MAG: beta strand repeat-containing protein [Bdellovibrio sp.]